MTLEELKKLAKTVAKDRDIAMEENDRVLYELLVEDDLLELINAIEAL